MAIVNSLRSYLYLNIKIDSWLVVVNICCKCLKNEVVAFANQEIVSLNSKLGICDDLEKRHVKSLLDNVLISDQQQKHSAASPVMPVVAPFSFFYTNNSFLYAAVIEWFLQ